MKNRVFTQSFVVVGGILEKDGKILLVQEAGSIKGIDKGKWSHPAGWLDITENPVEAAKREVLEEAGYDWEPTHIVGLYSLVREDVDQELNDVPGTPHALKVIFKGRIKSDSQQTLENDVLGTKWFTPEEIYAMGPNTLRDVDIKRIVKDYFDGKEIGLSRLIHTIQK